MSKLIRSFLSIGMVVLATQSFATHSLDSWEVLNGYHATSKALAHDQYLQTKAAAEALVSVLQDYIEQVGEDYPQYSLLIEMKAGAQRLSTTDEETELRLAMSALSKGAVSFVKTQLSLQSSWQAYQCPMVTQGEYNFWMQPKGEEMANPYMGLKMLHCGMKKAWSKVP